MTDLSPKRLIMLRIATSFALLVPSQNVKSRLVGPRYLLLVSSPAELASISITPCGWAASCVSLSFFLTLFSSITVYVQSPVIPCTYLLLVLSPLPYC
jgi:hypothetical protein